MANATAPPPAQNVPARRGDTNINELRKLMEQYKGQIAMALPKHITPERMIRVALTAFSRTPLLAQCSATSICGALVQASILGLEPDGLSGECFLIPYWNSKIGGYECSMQPGYRGIVKLARNSGEIRNVDAQPVHENDTFDFNKGSEVFWFHKWDPRKARGAIYGYYAGYTVHKGGGNFEFMSVAEIEAHRDQYSQGAYKKSKGKFILDADGKKILNGPWADSPDWMFRKTVLIKALKLAPKSIELRTALTLSDTADAGQAQAFVNLPVELNPVPTDETDIDAPLAMEEAKPEAAAESSPPAGVILISETQARRMEQIAEEGGWRQKEFLAYLKKDFKADSLADVKAIDYERIIEILRGGASA